MEATGKRQRVRGRSMEVVLRTFCMCTVYLCWTAVVMCHITLSLSLRVPAPRACRTALGGGSGAAGSPCRAAAALAGVLSVSRAPLGLSVSPARWLRAVGAGVSLVGEIAL